MRSLAALDCVACVCFLRKLWVWQKNPLKVQKTVRNEKDFKVCYVALCHYVQNKCDLRRIYISFM